MTTEFTFHLNRLKRKKKEKKSCSEAESTSKRLHIKCYVSEAHAKPDNFCVGQETVLALSILFM